MEDLRKYNPEGSTLRKAQMRMLEILKVKNIRQGLLEKVSVQKI